jgi:hypothetical protein
MGYFESLHLLNMSDRKLTNICHAKANMQV